MRCRKTLLLLVTATALLSGCTAFRVANAWLQSKADFVRCTSDPRLLCDPGSEALAASVLPWLPTAIATVEQAQYSAFALPIEIYTYRDVERYAAHSGAHPTTAGAVSLQRVNLSPLLLASPERTPGVLTHELSHLHLQLQMGSIAWARVPAWFHEGLATWVSGGGGAEKVSPNEAWQAIRAGKRFTPEEAQNPLFPKTAWHFGLASHQFYRQSALLVAYMHDLDPAAFKQMMLAISRTMPFAEAVSTTFKRDLASLWQAFLASDPARRGAVS